MTPKERLLSNTTKTSTCWIFRRKRKGRMMHNGVSRYASVWSYIIHRGPIPRGKKVCHTCDIPNCVRPSHLFLGSQSENIRDAVRKGRWTQAGLKTPMRGERHPMRKLTDYQVAEIRKGGFYKDVAKKYRVSPCYIHKLRRNDYRTLWPESSRRPPSFEP